MKFLFDNSLSPKLAKGLHVFAQPEHQVVHLKEKFPPNTEDEQWMKELASEEDWVVMSIDIRFDAKSHELQAWKNAGHPIFFLKPGWLDMPFWEQAARFAKCLNSIVEQAKRARIDQIFLVSANCKIEPLD